MGFWFAFHSAHFLFDVAGAVWTFGNTSCRHADRTPELWALCLALVVWFLATSAACCALVGVLWSITVAVLVVARHAM